MKRGQRIEGVVARMDFPNRGIVETDEGEKIVVKGALPGQRVAVAVKKARRDKAEGRLLEVLEKSPLESGTPGCVHAGECGGCLYRTFSYEAQLEVKAAQVRRLIDGALAPGCGGYGFLGIKESPGRDGYRNKMEFSFGDACRDGELALGLHRRGSFYDIVTASECRIVDGDFRTVLNAALSYFREKKIPYYHKMRHVGYLRHLLVRKAAKTGEILVDLVTTTQTDFAAREGEIPYAGTESMLLDGFVRELLAQSYEGTMIGILHTRNDGVADAVTDEGTDVLCGRDFFYEELLGLRFKITPFSFFQTNSLGAEVLYETAREFIGDALSDGGGKVVFDLYSGTGTIAQMLAPVAKKVVGVEIVEEAVLAARENARLNGLHNCEFLAGDVLKALDDIAERPDYIVLDPPRDGIHPKALEKIIGYGVPQMLYISCKPTSLARDLAALCAHGYEAEKVCCVDMFPWSGNVETVVKLNKRR